MRMFGLEENMEDGKSGMEWSFPLFGMENS